MKTVIVGGGFAGLTMAKKLAGKKDMEVVLIDKNNYHFFPPLIYQVATSFIEPSNISYPFRKLFQNADNVRFHNGKLTHIDVAGKTVTTDAGQFSYDALVLAMGTESNFFGMQTVQEHALPMKNIEDALNLRNKLLLNLEHATRPANRAALEQLTTIVIAGGGPTGVEIAGMLAEMDKHIIEKDYPELAHQKRQIYVVDAAAALLGPMSKKAQIEAFETLTKMGVHIILNVAVKSYENDTVLLSDGTEIPSALLIWASGVVAVPAPGIPQESVVRGKRLAVNEFNEVKGAPGIFAIGDLCSMTGDEHYPNGHPQLAQPAIQQGNLLAKNLMRMQREEALVPFKYKDKGSMAIIAKYKAVVDLPKGFFKGFFAWIVWLFIHIIPIAGFRNKVKLAFNWFWSFITNDPTLRLIIRPKRDPENPVAEPKI